MSRYDELFERLRSAREGAFIPYVTIGDPDPQTSVEIICQLVEAGADALELGIPFSDPIADGTTIQKATVRAMKAGARPDVCWNILQEVRARHPDVPIGLLVYANLVVQGPLSKFYERAASVGVDSILVADVPMLESEVFAQAAMDAGVCPVFIATPNATRETLSQVASRSRGYTYVVTRAGVTGAETEVDTQQHDLLSLLGELGAPPRVVGFGISRPEHVRAMLDAGAEGVISGSATIERIEANLGDPAAMLEALEAFVRAMKNAGIAER
ncbi:MAG: tryptophan synthase subunit alpha [Bradymonadaceae bacterium]